MLCVNIDVQVRRGGLTTFHGPGQLVCYPVLNLNSLRVGLTDSHMTYIYTTNHSTQIGVRQYVRLLEQSVISTLAHFGCCGYTSDDTGVWVTSCNGNPNKICAIGTTGSTQ